MNAVGIDISKGKSTVAALRPMGEDVYKRQVSLPLPFSLFLPAHPHRTIRAVFGPVGLRCEHGPAYGAVFHLVPALADLGVQGRVQRENGGPKPPAQQRIGNALDAHTFLSIVQKQAEMCIRDRP